MTRSSTASVGLSEVSRKYSKGKGKSRQGSNMDLPLQRKYQDDHVQVSPIIEDDKEDTANGEYEDSPVPRGNRRLTDQFIPQQLLTSTKDADYMKTYKSPEIVNQITNLLFNDIKNTFKKERQKLNSHKADNKENIPKNKEKTEIMKKASPNPLTKKSITKRKIEELKKPRKPKISDFVKIRIGDTLKQKSRDQKSPNQIRKSPGLKNMKSSKIKKTDSQSLDIEEKRRKQIGCDFLKFLPKKGKRKIKKIKKKIETRPVVHNYKEIDVDSNMFNYPEAIDEVCDRSLHINFTTKHEHKDFGQMASINSNKSSSLRDYQEIAIETSLQFEPKS